MKRPMKRYWRVAETASKPTMGIAKLIAWLKRVIGKLTKSRQPS